MSITSFLTFNHYVAYDGEHDKAIAVITKSGIVKYKARCDDADREKIAKFAQTEREAFHETFMENAKLDIKWTYRNYFTPYELSMTKEQIGREVDAYLSKDGEALYKLYMELEQAHYDRIYDTIHPELNGK